MVHEGTVWVSALGDNGLANSRFYTLVFGINRLRSDELPHCRAKRRCLGAVVQLLCNQNLSGISVRCTPITSANDEASSGFPTFRRAVRRSPDQSIHARLLLPIPVCALESDQLPYLCQVMVIVLGNKIQMIHEPHGLLETRMQARSRKNVRFKCPQMLH